MQFRRYQPDSNWEWVNRFLAKGSRWQIPAYPDSMKDQGTLSSLIADTDLTPWRRLGRT
jgi:hypothetical protein